MAALDTNVLVRILVEDDPHQLAAAKRLLRRAIDAGETLFVPVTVLLELEWVLRAAFGFGKARVTSTIANLLSTAELEFESEAAIEQALARYRERTVDFSDCLHLGLATVAGQTPLWTFDRGAAKLEGASRVI